MELEEKDAEAKVTFVPSLKWVTRGVAKPEPEKVQLTKEELVKIIKETKEKLNIAESGESSSSRANNESMSVEDEFKLENYDDDDETTGLQQLGIQSIAELPTEDVDNFDDDDSDKEDDIIKSSDNLILVGKVEGDASILEVYVHNESEGSLYCHHDLFLPSFPLCIEWLDFEPGQAPGSYCAVGSLSPVIDVWDLDVVNCLEPAYSLGRKGSRKRNVKAVGHEDAVLDLSWNRNYHHVVASGSVDQTVLLWDVETGEPTTKLDDFSEKVQCVEWHRLEGYTLLTGGCDNKARVFDCRQPEKFLSWEINGEAERMMWSTQQPFMFLVGTSEGNLQCFDCRKGLLWSIEAHEKEVTGLSISRQCPGLVVTASGDGSIKVWDVEGENEPVLVHDREAKLGNVHCLELSPDSPFIVAAGGDNKSNHFAVVDLTTKNDMVNQRFGSRPLIAKQTETMETSEPT